MLLKIVPRLPVIAICLMLCVGLAKPASSQEFDAKFNYMNKNTRDYYAGLICATYFVRRTRTDNSAATYAKFVLMRNFSVFNYGEAAKTGFGGQFPKTPSILRRADVADAERYTDHQILVMVRITDATPSLRNMSGTGCDNLYRRYKFLE
jgi:hypothetical protein